MFFKKNDPKHFHESVGFPCEWQASGGKHGTMIQDERDLASSHPGNMRLHNMLYVVIGCDLDMIILYSSILLTHQKWLYVRSMFGIQISMWLCLKLGYCIRKPSGVKIVSYRFCLPGQPGYPILYPYWNCQTLGAYRVLTHIQISEASGTSRCCKTTAGYSSGLAHCAWSVFSYHFPCHGTCCGPVGFPQPRIVPMSWHFLIKDTLTTKAIRHGRGGAY